MRRPICFDVTHLVSRLGIMWPSGIDKVDLAYGQHFVEASDGPFLHYGLIRPHVLSRGRARQIVQLSSATHWQGGHLAADKAFAKARRDIIGVAPQARAAEMSAPPFLHRRSWLEDKQLELTRLRLRLAFERTPVPADAVYLNVAQHLFEHDRFFAWLSGRPDVKSVFLIHDLLPIDYPEFFSPSEARNFLQRAEMALRRGKAFILTSEAVRQRLAEEFDRRRLPQVPMVVAPLPSSLTEGEVRDMADPALAAVPYFVTVGTIEPRKNHLLLLALWRQLGEIALRDQRQVPKLVVVGGRGWENEQVLDVLDRGAMTRPHVVEASGLSSAGLRALMANARAVLMPSFAEGYGLPLVEALSIGAPVVATDAPVFREVTQGCALYRDAVDGLGWHQAIRELTDPTSALSQQARSAAARFRPPTWEQYFDTVGDFLADL